jgi:predicted transcriptional regulator
MATTKKTVQAVLDTLPEDCSLEDVQYQLYLRQRLQKSVAAAAGRVVPHDEVKKRLAMWVAK